VGRVFSGTNRSRDNALTLPKYNVLAKNWECYSIHDQIQTVKRVLFVMRSWIWPHALCGVRELSPGRSASLRRDAMHPFAGISGQRAYESFGNLKNNINSRPRSRPRFRSCPRISLYSSDCLVVLRSRTKRGFPKLSQLRPTSTPLGFEAKKVKLAAVEPRLTSLSLNSRNIRWQHWQVIRLP
jgi:hypothetical protein